MCPTIASLLTQANWDGSVGGSRTRLLSDLSRSISPSIMIPEHRLATLLTAVQSNQVVSCRYHNTTIQPSLYTDHECSADDFPLQELITLKAHSDEVWYLEFSHDGTMLATAGKDGLVCVYDTARWKTMHEFREHEKNPSGSGHRGVCCVAFSPDDRYLISCSQNNEFAVLDVRDGRCVSRADHFDYPVTCAAWLPDSLTFVIGTQGSRRPLGIYYLRSSSSSSSSTSNGTSTTSSAIVKNNELHSFRDPAWDPNEKNNSFRISDVAVSADGTRMAAATTDNKILMYDLPKREKIAQWQMEDRLTSVNFDSSGAHMIVNMHKGKVLLLSAEVDARGNVAEVEVKCRYEGVVQDEFVIRSCFGGAGEDLVVSGSEGEFLPFSYLETLDTNATSSGRRQRLHLAPTDGHPCGVL